MNTMNEIKVVCPNCGEEFVANVNGELPVTKAQKRIAALKAAGVDVTGLFAMQTGNIAALDNGIISVVPDDDPIFDAIMNSGTIPDRRLFRRWVMAQMFHMLASGDFTKKLRNKGYIYQWKMIEDELKTQMKLKRDDIENYNERHAWFNKSVLLHMCRDYQYFLRKRIEYLTKYKTRKCKGLKYIRIAGGDTFVDDVYVKVMKPIGVAVERIYNCDDNNAAGLYDAYMHFKSVFAKIPECSVKMSASFIDAYKGVGAYYTMKNMILFHDCVFKNNAKQKISTSESMDYLQSMSESYADTGEGWRLFGLMKKLIQDNDIDIEQKMAEWRKR